MCLMYNCIFLRINLQQKHPHPGKSWIRAILFFNSLLLRRQDGEYNLWMVQFVLELHSSEAEFDTSCVLWTGLFWCIASVNKSLCWFRGEIWPMHKKKDNGGSIWQCLQIPQNVQWQPVKWGYQRAGLWLLVSMFCVHFPDRTALLLGLIFWD